MAGVAPNPRSIKRTLNVLRLVMALREAQSRALDLGDLQRLAKIVVLQTSYDALYRDTVAAPRLLVELENAMRNASERPWPRVPVSVSTSHANAETGCPLCRPA